MADSTQALEDALAGHRRLAFPAETGDDLVDDLHADLVLYDNDAVGLARRAAREPDTRRHLLRRGQELRKRALQLREGTSSEVRDALEEYLHYVDSILGILNAANG